MIASTLEIKRINSSSAKELTDLLSSSSENYSRYFIPFEFKLQTITDILNKAVADMYYGIFVNEKLVGFYMLRGWDSGYQIPSYGVWISESYTSRGLSKLTLQHAISVCRLNSINKLMLKVHPDNKIAKKIYEDFGFVQTGVDEKIGHLIYIKEIN